MDRLDATEAILLDSIRAPVNTSAGGNEGGLGDLLNGTAGATSEKEKQLQARSNSQRSRLLRLVKTLLLSFFPYFFLSLIFVFFHFFIVYFLFFIFMAHVELLIESLPLVREG